MTHSYELGDTIKRATSSHSRLIVGIAIASSLAALAPTPPHAADARITGCATSGLVVWTDTQGSGAAGSVFYKLRFTNLSGHACTLAGYPGVSAVDLRGHRLGREAAREPSQRRAVRLAKGASATATLRIIQAGNFPSSTCHKTTAAGLRVYPPNQRTSKLVPFPFNACSRVGPVYLMIRAVG